MSIQTVYRQTELQAWLQLDHPNVLPLLGVMWGGQGGHHCFQFMPKMTSDLSSVMRSVGDLCTLVRSESLDQWENVLKPNISHVVKNLVCGVNYLHQKGVQHCDLKGIPHLHVMYNNICGHYCIEGFPRGVSLHWFPQRTI